MTNVNPDQTHLDNDTAGEITAETTIINNFGTIIADLKSQPGSTALDFTNADAFLAQITADAAATTAQLPPATTTPTPTTPASTTPKAAGGPVNPANP